MKFNLSELSIESVLGKSLGVQIFRGEDIKEFIKLLKESRWATEDAIEEINKLAGDKLNEI